MGVLMDLSNNNLHRVIFLVYSLLLLIVLGLSIYSTVKVRSNDSDISALQSGGWYSYHCAYRGQDQGVDTKGTTITYRNTLVKSGDGSLSTFTGRFRAASTGYYTVSVSCHRQGSSGRADTYLAK